MLRASRVFAIAVVLIFGLIGAANAGVEGNFGFEQGFDIWITNNLDANHTFDVVTSANYGGGVVYNPQEGSHFGLLKSLSNDTVETQIFQGLQMNLGETVTGRAFFKTFDSATSNDYAAVRITDTFGTVIATPWSRDASMVGDQGHSSWSTWTWTAPATDNYILFYVVANGGSPANHSEAGFDAVPIPPSLLLLGTGLVGLLGFRRRFLG
jgi:hypothetical protein